MESKQEFLPAAQPVAAFDEFRSQLNELQIGNSKAVFDYRDSKGNKEARSHVAKLRTAKAAIEKKRVAEKEEFLVKGRLVDADAKHLTAVVQSMIEVHETPLKEIENEEKARIHHHKNRIAQIESIVEAHLSDTADNIQGAIESIEHHYVMDESWEEFLLEGTNAKNKAIDSLKNALLQRKKYEEEQSELSRLRAEASQREQKEREERIAKESAENARMAAEQAAANAIRDSQLATERAQREKAESEAREKQAVIDAQARELAQKQATELATKHAAEKAERDRLQAIADTEARIAREKAQEKAEAEQREKNKAHAKRINNEILQDFMVAGLSEECAKTAITAMAKNQVRNVKINY